ncbi:MAG TPA: TRZ/ATZ family hydrolase [Rhodocyclaceae bacterium]|nr:TRZ/ATZ family hydrolase [Rhodocyclaceae bacterium]
MPELASRQAIDLLIQARWIIPIEPHGTVLENHALAVQDGVIVALLPTSDAETKFQAKQRVELPDHVLMPGLVNLHTHAAMTLLRGYADDLPLMSWLQDKIWPAEGKHVSPQFVRDGTLLAAAEMLRGGVTCCSDMYFYPEAAAEAFLEAGMRAALGIVTLEFPTNYAADASDYLAKGLAARDRFRNETLLSFTLAPHAPYTVSDPTLERVATLSAQLNLPVHIHVHETKQEIKDSLQAHGVRPLARMERLGLIGPDLIAVHTVHLEQEEIVLLSRMGSHIAHCPTSNMKLGSGISPVATAIQQGVPIGLGTDGAASNNRLDMFNEMRQAALIGKAATLDPSVLDTHTVLRMATLNGAQALGLGDSIGSLLPGKQADLCAVKLDDWIMQPCFDPASHLVYVSGREQVSHVWVDGKLRVDNTQIANLEASKLLGICRLWQNKLIS